ncbi:hypothetical protein ACFSUS_09050 [Spirosoma soli]|uniref:Lipoprotein n=1 Tax=Spirosoma soli TaxID=1770529 RepID=A0ABW5M163_9BACT
MKTVKSRIRLLLYVSCLAGTLYNCGTKDVEPVTPFTYTFKGFDNVKLPEVTPTAPAAVSVTAASVTSSTAAAAVSSGLSNLTATGQVPAAVQEAAANVSKAIPAEKAAQLVASFTPDVLNTVSTGGKLPANLETEVKAMAANPATKGYWPTYTLPTVNGKPVGGRASAPSGASVVPATPVAYATTDDDACKAAANAAYNSAVQNLDAAKASQTAAINSNYTQLETAIKAEAAPCKAGLPAKYDPMRALAKQTLDASLANLDAGKAVLGETTYNLLKVLLLASYADGLNLFTTLQNAEAAACDATGTAKLAAAQAARDADLSKINSNYNNALSPLTRARDQAVASCHNQGNGG